MSFYSLPLKGTNEKIPVERCYLSIALYSENSFKPKDGKKRLTKEEIKSKNERIFEQTETLKRLDSGYMNLYNRTIEADNILSTSFPKLDKDFDKYIVYRIEPTLSREETQSYYRDSKYLLSEFKVIKKITNQKEMIKQVHDDRILTQFLEKVFESYSYSNEEYVDLIYNYFRDVKTEYPDFEISLSDLVITSDYTHAPTERFSSNNIYQVTKDNIEKLLCDNLISYTKTYDWYQSDVIVTLINCGMSHVAFDYLNHLTEDSYVSIIADKNIDIALRLHSTDEYVKKIIAKLNIKLSGVTLKIEKYLEYGETSTSEKRFENIGEIKSYLIKEFDVPFEKLQSNDISTFGFSNEEDTSYTFTIE